MKIKLNPVNSRFKRLINDFGPDWCAVCDPKPMICFDGILGVTAMPASGKEKWSNFKLSDIELIGE